MATATVDGDVNISTTHTPGRMSLTIDCGSNAAVDLVESLFEELGGNRQLSLLQELALNGNADTVELMLFLYEHMSESDEFLKRLRAAHPDDFEVTA